MMSTSLFHNHGDLSRCIGALKCIRDVGALFVRG